MIFAPIPCYVACFLYFLPPESEKPRSGTGQSTIDIPVDIAVRNCHLSVSWSTVLLCKNTKLCNTHVKSRTFPWCKEKLEPGPPGPCGRDRKSASKRLKLTVAQRSNVLEI